MKNVTWPTIQIGRWMGRSLALLGALAVPFTALQAADEIVADPFHPTVATTSVSTGEELQIKFTVPAGHHLYRDQIKIALNAQEVATQLPAGHPLKDPTTGEMREAYETNLTVTVRVPELTKAAALSVAYQGCNEESCFFPQSREYRVGLDGTVVALDDSASQPDQIASSSSEKLLAGFEVSRRASGFMSSEKMVNFLEGKAAEDSLAAASAEKFTGWGRLLIIGGILLGGLALNLTPCVLPMIPINLAIMGAGANRASRKRGFLLGGTYGLAMTLVYGVLGLVVVLTGAKFGSLNASPWFNFGIAIVFIVLGLAMFDKFAIDLSRFSSSGSGGQPKNNWLLAASMGGVAALLAGACVAPVVISVLLLSTSLHQAGSWAGVLLPFVLGLGMALPWPFAGAGLSFLPKPGSWMTRVKYGFGVLIFVFAAWYGWLGVKLLDVPTMTAQARPAGMASFDENVSNLKAAFAEAQTSNRPVFVDFWASWCKNCEAMEATTYRDTEVRSKLKNYIIVKFQAERLNDPGIKGVLDEFGVLGLPTCVIVQPGGGAGGQGVAAADSAAHIAGQYAFIHTSAETVR